LPRSWGQLLGEEAAEPDTAAERAGLFSRLRDSLSKSRQALTAELASAAFDPGDAEAWERLEEALIRADVGVPATAELVQRLEARPDLTDLNAALAAEIATLLGEPATLDVRADPSVLLIVGVNGTGKTTTIGKLAERLRQHGHSVVLGAADTFRAAAEEQLEIWADRAEAEFVGAERGADPASVAYDAIEAATRDGRDVVIVDTAGRLHTQTNLMEARGRAARNAARRRRDDRAERFAAGTTVRRGSRRDRRRTDEARRERERRHCSRDRPRARTAGQADRRRGTARRPEAVRSG
jgi:fused signal recognition particle receptor